MKILKNIEISTNLKESFQQNLFLLLGNTYYNCHYNYVISKTYFLKVYELQNNRNYLSKIELATVLKNLGKTHATTHDDMQAIYYCEKSIELCDETSNFRLLEAENLQIIGDAYRKINNFEKAKKYSEKALERLSILNNAYAKELKSTIYEQLAIIYIMYRQDNGCKIAKKYNLMALETMEKEELCSSSKNLWNLGKIYTFCGEYENALKIALYKAEQKRKETCPENKYLEGRIFGTMGEALLRTKHLKEAENSFSLSINLIEKLLGKSPSWLERLFRIETRIRLGKLEEAYKDYLYLDKIDKIEINNLCQLMYPARFYHAAIIKYKQRDLKDSLQYFSQFFKSMNIACKAFLNEKTYVVLDQKNVFNEIIYKKESEVEDIRKCLQRSLDIFTAIYGPDHPFIKDYVFKNYKEALESSFSFFSFCKK